MTKKQEQARRVFANYCNKTNSTVGGAQLNSEDGMQYVCNHFMACRYKDKVDDLKPAQRCVNFQKFIDEVSTVCYTPYCMDDIKPVDGSDNLLCTLGASGVFYDYTALKKMLNTFNGKIAALGISRNSKFMGKGINALYVQDTDGNEGFILAMRPMKD